MQPPTRPCSSTISQGQLTPSGSPQYPPIFIIPYPLPIGPNPSTCPCYLVEPNKNPTTTPAPTTQSPITNPSVTNNNQLQYGILGFIPIILFPNCPGNATDPNLVQSINPSAVPVPYQCSQCQNYDQGRQIKFLDLGPNGGESFKEVIEQAGIKLYDTPVRTFHRGTKKFRSKLDINS